MSVDKKISYEKDKPAVQGGVENYLGRQPEVQAPRKWKSSPDKPETELAYITKAEKDLILKANIHGGLEKGPNMGPSGIMSLDSFGDIGGAGAAGADTAASGEAMSGRGFSGIGPNESRQDFANRKAAQRANLQRAEKAQADRLGYRERKNIANFKSKPKSKFGMNLLSGLMSLINPALGLFTRGINLFQDKLQDLRGYDEFGNPLSQADYEKARLERQLTSRLDNLYDRKLSGKNYSQKNIDMLESMGVTTSKDSLKSAIDRDIAMNPEMPQFATSYIQSLAQPKVNTMNFQDARRAMTQPFTVSGPNRDFEIDPYQESFLSPDRNSMFTTNIYESPTKSGIETIDVGFDDPAFDNALMADVSASDINRLLGTTYGTSGQQKYAPNTDIDTIRTIEGPFLNPSITDQEIKDVLNKRVTSPTGKFA